MKKSNMEHKKGELTSQQLITLIILIVSFVIILAFFFMLNLHGKIDEESCKSSLSFAQIPLGSKIVNIKCRTQDVCINMGGSCLSPSKDVRKIRVGSGEEAARELSDLIARCWNTFGEGQIKYGGNGDCGVCYKVYFDDKIKSDSDIKKNNGISYFSVYESMKRKISDKNFNYLFYLYSTSDFEAVRLKLFNDGKGIDISSNGDRIDVNGEYAIVTGFSSKSEQFAPLLVKFSADELSSKTKCSNYITEI